MEKLILMVGAASDKGNVREVNQDNILVEIGEYEGKDFGMFVVCDGLGGLTSGEIASKMAIVRLKKWWEEELIYLIKRNLENDLQRILAKIIKEINRNIIEYGIEIESNVGTTLSLIFIYKGKYYVAHVGDSRIYCLKNEIVQVTEDHSYVSYKVKNHMMTADEAKKSNEKNLLLQCVGVKNNLDIFFTVGEIKQNEIFIICSDGFYNKLEKKDVTKHIKANEDFDNETLQETSEELVQIVKNRGETDNISVILVGVKNKVVCH
ncbi:MAG: serine/threonine-protein phosphatase [Clostridium sp.]|nr:serine/threonine-protein phosphatase [Clostridium sp.]